MAEEVRDLWWGAVPFEVVNELLEAAIRDHLAGY